MKKRKEGANETKEHNMKKMRAKRRIKGNIQEIMKKMFLAAKKKNFFGLTAFVKCNSSA